VTAHVLQWTDHLLPGRTLKIVPTEYAMCEGRIVSSGGLDLAVREYEFHFEERHIPHSNALHSYQKGRGNYCVGPMARFSLNYDTLSPTARQVAEEVGLKRGERNPFRSIIVRSIETIYAIDEALRILGNYDPSCEPAVHVEPRPGIGFGASEAPRGLLYHRYRIDGEGTILDAKIVPPTAQNQPTIEDDVRKFVTKNIDLPREELTWKCEQAVRNYDPCISCATHFVKLEIDC